MRTIRAFPAFPDEQPPWAPFPTVSADSLACKMKSEEAILATLDENPEARPLECRDLNQAAWDRAWQGLDEEARQRVTEAGVAKELLPDLDFSTGVGWTQATLIVELPRDGSSTYRVRSPRLFTSQGAPLGLGGNHYCKLLPPTRALEWLLAKDFVSTEEL